MSARARASSRAPELPVDALRVSATLIQPVTQPYLFPRAAQLLRVALLLPAPLETIMHTVVEAIFRVGRASAGPSSSMLRGEAEWWRDAHGGQNRELV